MKARDEEIIGLFNRHSKLLMRWISEFYPFNEDQIAKYSSSLDWNRLSLNEQVNWTTELIDKYKNKLDWRDSLCRNAALPWSIDFLHKYGSKFGSKELLSGNLGMPFNYDFLNHFKDRWNWHWLTVNPSINWTEKMFHDFDLWDQNLSRANGNNLWTEEFILKNKSKLFWGHLCYNPNLPWTEELIDKLKPTWRAAERKKRSFTVSPWSGLSENTGIPWTKRFISNNLPIPLLRPLGFYWDGLSRNESLPWEQNLIDDYSDKWDWELISCNCGVGFTLEHLERYDDKIKWKVGKLDYKSIAINSSLPWSEYLIDKYSEKLHWFGLSMNTGIPWNDLLIDKYIDKLDNYIFFRNPSIQWSLDFVLKYEKDCFRSWNYIEPDKYKKTIWERVFKPFVNEGNINKILSFS